LTAKESKKRAKEGDRVLRMKNKPLHRKTGDADLPKFNGGKKWRVINSSSRVKQAIDRA
jgi:hypothetical protein